MLTRPDWLVPTILAGVILIMAESTQAQTQADLDAATLAASIAEQQKKAAEARKAAAVAEAEAAAAAAKVRSDSDKAKADTDKAVADAEKAKAEAGAAAAKAANDVAKGKADSDKSKSDADKAQIDALKAGLPTPPDPSKYKVEKPSAPALNANDRASDVRAGESSRTRLRKQHRQGHCPLRERKAGLRCSGQGRDPLRRR